MPPPTSMTLPPGKAYVCHSCGRKGHWRKDCPKNPKNKKLSNAGVSETAEKVAETKRMLTAPKPARGMPSMWMRKATKEEEITRQTYELDNGTLLVLKDEFSYKEVTDKTSPASASTAVAGAAPEEAKTFTSLEDKLVWIQTQPKFVCLHTGTRACDSHTRLGPVDGHYFPLLDLAGEEYEAYAAYMNQREVWEDLDDRWSHTFVQSAREIDA